MSSTHVSDQNLGYFAVYSGLYYPVRWGFEIISHYKDPFKFNGWHFSLYELVS